MTQPDRREEWQGQFESFGAVPTAATLDVRHRPPAERVRRSLGAFFGCLLGGAVLVLIPLLHILMALGALTAAIYFGIQRSREDVSLLGAQGVCPRCTQTVSLTPGGRATTERKVHCPHCREQLLLTTTRRD